LQGLVSITIMSFLSSEFPPAKPAEARFHVIPAPFEFSVSYGGGTALGPKAILHASQQLEANLDGTSPGAAGIATLPQPDNHTLKSQALSLSWLQHQVASSISTGALPIILGGEHSLTEAPLRAFIDQGEPFGVILFDAHANLRAEYQGNPRSHACIARHIVDLGIPIVQIGTRSLSHEEAEFRANNKIAFVDALSLHRHGLPTSLLPQGFPKRVYVSFDVDVLDSSLMPSTGTPEPGGLTWQMAIDCLENALLDHELIGAELVELAPILHLHAPDYAAAKLAYHLMRLAL